MRYDIIGDIHRCSRTLVALLRTLGCRKRGESGYSHPLRQAVFLGDFIDRGPAQREVLGIVRTMFETNAAFAVMGNHEYNAIAYATRDSQTGDFLRPHSENNERQHIAFLDAHTSRPQEYEATIEWFKALPLWLDLGGIRVVHACWDREAMGKISTSQGGSSLLSRELLVNSCRQGTWQFESIETLLKGKEIPLKEGVGFKDKEGTVRHHIRVRWWDQHATTYKNMFMGPESARTHIPDDEVAGDLLVEYSHQEPPVFLGHYWLEGPPAPLADNIACVDFSVAKCGGKLVAYRWGGERELSKEKFVSMDRIETG